jgi:hypothetical protein
MPWPKQLPSNLCQSHQIPDHLRKPLSTRERKFYLVECAISGPYDCDLSDQEVALGVKIRKTFWAAGHKEVCVKVVNFGEVSFPTQSHEQNGVEVNYRFRPAALVNDGRVKINMEVCKDHKIESMDQKLITLEAHAQHLQTWKSLTKESTC